MSRPVTKSEATQIRIDFIENNMIPKELSIKYGLALSRIYPILQNRLHKDISYTPPIKEKTLKPRNPKRGKNRGGNSYRPMPSEAKENTKEAKEKTFLGQCRDKNKSEKNTKLNLSIQSEPHQRLAKILGLI